MSRPRSIYVVSISYLFDLFFIFSLVYIVINQIRCLNRRTCFMYILKMSLINFE